MCIRCFQWNCTTPTWGNETGSLCVAVLQLRSYQRPTLICHEGKGLGLYIPALEAGRQAGRPMVEEISLHFTPLNP